jgi:peptidoglycan/LPS O-acetylase OafA/YrhL
MGGVCRYIVSKQNIITSSFIMLFPALLSLALACLYADPYSYIQMILLFFFFSLTLASGNNVRILSNKYSLVMGDVSYGIYMIHGVVIFLIFRTGLINTKGMSVWIYFSLFPLVMLAVTFLASYSLIYIERPSMKLAVNISKKMKIFGAK